MNVTCFIFWDCVQKFKIVNVDKFILISVNKILSWRFVTCELGRHCSLSWYVYTEVNVKNNVEAS